MSAGIMNWESLASTLVGALITYSAIVLTQAMDLWKRKRTHEKLMEALLHAIREEIESLLEMAAVNAPSVEDTPDGKPYERLFSARQDYFTVYHANAALVMQIKQAELRRNIFRTYLRAKGLLDTVSMNRLYLERFHYLQSTYLKTKDPTAKSAAEKYREMLIQIGGQLRRSDAGFRSAAAELMQQISLQLAQNRRHGCAANARDDDPNNSPTTTALVYGTPE